MFSTSCKDNTDSSCYCKDEKLVLSVYQCLSAWGQDDSEIQAAITYLVGVCAPFIPSNPGIITNCPSSIQIKPTSTSNSVPTVAPTTVTTVVVEQTVTTCPVGATVTSGDSTTVLQTPSVSTAYVTRTIMTCDKCNEIPGPQTATTLAQPYVTIAIPGLSTTAIVPQVGFATNTADGGSAAVVLAPTGSSGGNTITGALLSQPTPSSYTFGNASVTTKGPEQFQGAGSKVSSSWIMGVLVTLAAVVFA